jgi:pyrroline-5-carboxylate reductase
MSKLGIIGAGAMGQAIAKGLVSAGFFHASDIALFDLRQEVLIELKAYEFKTYNTVSELIDSLVDDGILLIAVKPQNINDLLHEIETAKQNALKQNVIIVSICAGVKISKFEEFFPRNPIIRVMPNTPAQIAKGASVLAPNKNCTDAQIQEIQKIFSCLGLALVLDEAKLDAVTALSGSGPAYVFLLIEAMTLAGVRLGLDEADSKALARETVFGSACLVAESGKEASELRAQVTSPKGTTQAALDSFAENDFNEIVFKAIDSAYKRSVELG